MRNLALIITAFSRFTNTFLLDRNQILLKLVNFRSVIMQLAFQILFFQRKTTSLFGARSVVSMAWSSEIYGIQKKVALGCDSGFGKQLSIQLARKGHCRVIAGCLTDSGCEDLQNLALPSLFTVPIDVANEESVRCARNEVKKILNGEGLWGLVNNAGVATLTGFTDWTTKREISYCMSVNSIGECQRK